MKLFELFDRALPYKWTSPGENAIGEFQVGDMTYRVTVKVEVYDEPYWDVTFEAIPTASVAGAKPVDWRIDNTNTGNQFAVYTTVIQMVIDHVKRYGAKPIYMLAFDDGRMSLYARMLKKLLPSNWEITADNNEVYATPR